MKNKNDRGKTHKKIFELCWSNFFFKKKDEVITHKNLKKNYKFWVLVEIL